MLLITSIIRHNNEVSHPYSCCWDLRGSVYDPEKEKGAAVTGNCNERRPSQGRLNYRVHKS